MKRPLKLEWGLALCQISNLLLARHPIYPTSLWLLNCWTKKYSHFRYAICPATIMHTIPIVRLKKIFLPLSHMSDIIPTHGPSKCFSMCYSILILCLYIKMKNKKKPLLSVTGQSIPWKTHLRENVLFSHYNYCNEVLESSTKHFLY